MTDQPPRDVLRCPIHDATDCSALLNGCTIPNRLAAAWLAGRDRVLDDRVRLERWKSEALDVMAGLDELGKVLNLPLGERVTGPVAVEAARRLRDRARDEERAAWSSWLDNWMGAVGPAPPTVEAVAAWLRADGPRPFGTARVES